MRSPSPLFSIVIPTHKRPELLIQAIDSVRAQSLEDYECIVVSDVDEEVDLISSMIAKLGDSRFSFAHNQFAKGGNGSRNLGIQSARGTYVAFLDDDDWWLPEKLAAHLAAHEQSGAGLVYSTVYFYYDTTKRVVAASPLPELSDPVAWLLSGECPATSTIVTVRRSLFADAGLFDPELVSLQDWDMWFRLAPLCTFHQIDRALAVFRQHDGDRTSINPERRIRGIEQIVAKWGPTHDVSRFASKLRLYAEVERARGQLRSGARAKAARTAIESLRRARKLGEPNAVRTAASLLMQAAIGPKLFRALTGRLRSANASQFDLRSIQIARPSTPELKKGSDVRSATSE